MPKKSSKDGSDARKRRGSTKDGRGAVVTAAEEVLMPPTPKAKHLFASNPFDDPPHSNNIGGSAPNYMRGSPRLMNPPMHMPSMSPNYMAKGLVNSPGWKSAPGMHGPMAPGWPQNQPDVMGPMGPNYPCGIPGMDYNRMPMPSQPQIKPPYSAPMPGPEFPREGLPYDQINLDHGPPIQAPLGHPVNSYQKPVVRKQDKLRKGDSSMWYNKNKKTKTESSPVIKSSDSRIQDWSADNEKSSPTISKDIPHAALPSLPQVCMKCSKQLEEPLENTICCLASCNGWYHRSCTGLTAEAHECLKNEELALWACDKCLGSKEITSVRLRKISPDIENSMAISVNS